MSEPIFLIVDLFCGAGGTTTGFAQAELDGNSVSKVIACVNHDAKAIQSHWQNHPEVRHFEEDIRTLNLTGLIGTVKWWKDRYPDAYLVLWASLECTNFSKAKGGQPRDADSRTLAEHLHRYIDAINPDYVQIENVVEFMSWGPLDENGKPISKKNGEYFERWKKEMNSHGYFNDWKELNSANFGAYTSRNRLFGCFARPGLPIVWPQPTHAKNPIKETMFNGSLKKWKAVKDVLDFTDEGESIFNRSTPLVDKTLERIYAGLIKFVAKGDTAFISKYFSGRPAGKVASINQPAGVVTTVGGQALVQTEFLAAYYGNGDNCSSVENPCPVIPTKDRFQLIKPEFFIDKHFGSSAQNQSIHAPAGSILPNDKHRLVEAVPFIMDTQYNNNAKSTEDPLNVITADRHYHYIINPAWGGNLGSIENPCCVVVARQDKAPLYFVQVESGSVQIAVYDTDSEIMIKIKQFMVAYGLIDIKMRMLRVVELLRIQGFPEGYHLYGTQQDQKKFIGNSVVPHVVKAWCEAMASEIIRKIRKAA